MKYVQALFFNSDLERKKYNELVDERIKIDNPEYGDIYQIAVKGMSKQKVYECIDYLLA